MPFVRIVPVALLAAAWLVLSTAQRLLLLWLAAPRLHGGLSSGFDALARGARLDLACAAVVVAPVALLCTLAPEKLWRARLVRRAAYLLFATACVALVSLLSVDALQFGVNQARLAHPMRERIVVAWRLLAGDEGRAKLATLVVIACLLSGLALAGILRKPFLVAWKEKAEPILRGRDVILVITACALALLIRPEGQAFGDQPVLSEIAGSSAPALAHATLDRLRGSAGTR
jgi:hypothetical protein